MHAVTSLMRVQQLVIGRLDALLKPHGLTFARYEALVLLVFSSRGSLPLGKMGERLQVHPTSVTSIVRRLEAAGSSYAVPHPEDGRAVLAEITDAGRALVEKATADLVGADFGLGVLARRRASWRIRAPDCAGSCRARRCRPMRRRRLRGSMRRAGLTTADDVRRVGLALPRTYEREVRGRWKLKVRQIVYVAFSRDELAMGFGFPRAERDGLVASDPETFFLPRASDLRYQWVCAHLPRLEPERCASWSPTPGGLRAEDAARAARARPDARVGGVDRWGEVRCAPRHSRRDCWRPSTSATAEPPEPPTGRGRDGLN